MSPHVTFCNMLFFYGEELLAPHPTPKLEDHPLLGVYNCLFIIFTVTFHIWRPPPSATWGCAMPWWHGTHLTFKFHKRQGISWLAERTVSFLGGTLLHQFVYLNGWLVSLILSGLCFWFQFNLTTYRNQYLILK
jgi:hypothetical protein